jgi:arylsulfatase A-like enzyme
VAQKASGYVAGSLDFTQPLVDALTFVDHALGSVVDELKKNKVFEKTLIVVCSKHGQAAIDPTKYGKIAPGTFNTVLNGITVDFITTDDVALIFLHSAADTNAAVAKLNAQRSALKIQDIIYGDRLIQEGFGDPTNDPNVPNIIVLPEVGIIYTGSSAKIEEHGGLSNDDRSVACFLSSPGLKFQEFGGPISTAQMAPTILQVLGLQPKKLQGAVKEGTRVLPGFDEE